VLRLFRFNPNTLRVGNRVGLKAGMVFLESRAQMSLSCRPIMLLCKMVANIVRFKRESNGKNIFFREIV